MRDNIKSFISFCCENIKIDGIVIEVGSYQVEGQIGYADLRPFFKKNFYIGVDLRKGIGVDTIHDVHSLGFKSSVASWVLCLDTLEHVKNPLKAVEELKRILKKEGIIILSSVMDFPIHDHPWDYWRFTPQIFEEMLSSLKYKMVFYQGAHLKPHTVIAIGSDIYNFNNLNFPTILSNEKLYIYNREKTFQYRLEDTLEFKYSNLEKNYIKLKKEYNLLKIEYEKLKCNLNNITSSLSWKFILLYRKYLNLILSKIPIIGKFYKKFINLIKNDSVN